MVQLDPSDLGGTGDIITEKIIPKGSSFHVFDRIDRPAEGGIYIYYKGMPYPKKGLPFPEAIYMNDITKRMTVTIAKSFISKETILPASLVLFYPWKTKVRMVNKILTNYCRMTQWIHASYAITDERLSAPCRSINLILRTFLENMGITIGRKFAKTIALVVEYDDMYRYRIEDIMSCTSRSRMMDNPAREIRRLGSIMRKRERTHAMDITSKLFKAASIAFMHPKVKKAWRKTMESITDADFDGLKLDTADSYHALILQGYDFMGMDLKERLKLYIDFHTKSVCCNRQIEEKYKFAPFNPEDIYPCFCHGPVPDPSHYVVCCGECTRKDCLKNVVVSGYECKKCGKPCEIIQDFPPRVEVA